MKQLFLYRILSFILLPVAALLGIITILMLLAAASNSMLLILAFVFASVVIYTIASFIFLQKGIGQNELCNHSLRDWIRVNAIVSIIFCVFYLLGAAALLSDATLLKNAVKQAMEQQQSSVTISEADFLKVMKGLLYFLLVYSGLLLLHIILTFRLLKTYKHLFKEKE
ncbi:MAG: hypothetical protein V4722_18920 [Bacteroidota bacterium]